MTCYHLRHARAKRQIRKAPALMLSFARAREGAGHHQEARRLASRAAEAFRALGLERHLAAAERLAT